VPVRAFPTWVLPGGRVVEGELSLDALEAALAGGDSDGSAAVAPQ
jgi:hypothetical protein